MYVADSINAATGRRARLRFWQVLTLANSTSRYSPVVDHQTTASAGPRLLWETPLVHCRSGAPER